MSRAGSPRCGGCWRGGRSICRPTPSPWTRGAGGGAGEGVAGLPGEETVTAQYWALARMAREAGYEHYEISNYARRGFRSRHNQVYWRAEEYLALGPGACGFLGDVRYGNVKPVERYCTALEAGGLPLGTHEVLTPAQRKAEKVILGLRLSDGVPLAWLEDARSLVETWASLGLLEVAGDRCRLTEAGGPLSP